MNPKRRPLPPTNDPTGAAGADPTGLLPTGDPTGLDAGAGMPDLSMDPTAGGAPVGGDTGGLTNDELAQIDLGALTGGDAGGGAGDMGGLPPDQGAQGAQDQVDPEVQALLEGLQSGDPQAMQMLDLAARRRLAGA